MEWIHFSLWILHLQNQTTFKWSAHQGKVVRLGTILRRSSTQHKYQEEWHGRQLLSPPSPRWSNRLSQSIRIPMNPQIHMGLAVNIQSCRSASMISTFRPTHSMRWLLWPWFEQRKNTAQSPEPSILSPISRPTMNVSTIEGWETTHTTKDDSTFYSEHEPRRVYWEISSEETFDSNEPRHISFAWSPSSILPPPRRQRRKLSMGMSFPKKRGVWQHSCEACGLHLLAKKTP